MGATSEYFLIMREQDYLSLTPEQRQSAIYTEVKSANEYLDNYDDPVYQKLYKAQKNAKKELEIYLYNKKQLKK